MKRIYEVFVVDVNNPTSDQRDALGTVSEFSKATTAWSYARWLMRHNPNDRVVITVEPGQ